MKLFRNLIKYIELIVNMFSNALIQTFLVYTTVVLIYKFFIEEQTTNYIPTFIRSILDKIKNTYNEINYMIYKYSDIKKTDFEEKYNAAELGESKIHKNNKAHNNKIINNAFKMSIGIIVIFVLFTLVTRQLQVNIHWYKLLLSAAITVVGTTYEYFFITQVIVKYNFIELTRLYDAAIWKIENMTNNILNNELVPGLEAIVKKHDVDQKYNTITKTVDVLKDVITDEDIEETTHNDSDIGNEADIEDNIETKTEIGKEDTMIVVANNDMVNKVGTIMNDVDNNELKNTLEA